MTNKVTLALIFLITCLSNTKGISQDFHKDVIQTLGGDLEITFIGHGTLMLEFQEKVIHVDPWGRLADYSKLPKADAILITHEHGDHLDPEAINTLTKEDTQIFLNQNSFDQIEKGQVLRNGDYAAVAGLPVEVVPAYNTLSRRGNGKPYHPKGEGNGYIISFNDVRVYIAGDTEYYSEMEQFQAITVAFLPMNMPYTMSPELVAIAAKAIHPKILYPYHFGETKPEELVKLLFGTDIDVRIRPMK